MSFRAPPSNERPRPRFAVITPSLPERSAFLQEAKASVAASVRGPLDFDVEHRFHAFPERPRPGAARNHLIRGAAPDAWLVPLDDDDLLLQRGLYHWAELVLRHPDARWFVTDFVRVDAAGRYLPGQDYTAWTFDTPQRMLTAIFRGEHFLQGNVCFARSLFDEAGGYDATLETAEDLDLYVRFVLAGHLPVRGAHVSHLHRVHGGNISRHVDAAHHRADLVRMYRRHAGRLEALGVAPP
jgi:hypothetical protein